MFTITWAEKKSVFIQKLYITDKTDPQGVGPWALCRETVICSTFLLGSGYHSKFTDLLGKFPCPVPFPMSIHGMR